MKRYAHRIMLLALSATLAALVSCFSGRVSSRDLCGLELAQSDSSVIQMPEVVVTAERVPSPKLPERWTGDAPATIAHGQFGFGFAGNAN